MLPFFFFLVFAIFDFMILAKKKLWKKREMLPIFESYLDLSHFHLQTREIPDKKFWGSFGHLLNFRVKTGENAAHFFYFLRSSTSRFWWWKEGQTLPIFLEELSVGSLPMFSWSTKAVVFPSGLVVKPSEPSFLLTKARVILGGRWWNPRHSLVTVFVLFV